MNKEEFFTEFSRKVIAAHHPSQEESYRLEDFAGNEEFGNGGLTGSIIKKAIADNGKVLFFFKGYPLELEKLAYTYLLIPLCSKLRELPLKKIKLVLPIAESTVLIDGAPFQIIATPAAPGASAVDLIRDLAQNSISEEAFLHIVQEIASGLEELNTLSVHNSFKLPQEVEKLEDLCINVFRLFLQENPDRFPFTLPQFEHSFAKIFKDAHAIPFQTGYIHGDGNLTNIFHNIHSHQTYLIDSLTIFHSIQPNGLPAGNIAHEYCNVRRSFDIFGFYYGLEETVRGRIDHVFITSYHLPIPQPHIAYYDLLAWMSWFIITNKTLMKSTSPNNNLPQLLEFLAGKIHLCLA